METIEYRTVDKSGWPRRGEWDDEPDKVQWKDEATGLPCLIVRNGSGALCGYVGMPVGHRWHGVDYDNVRFYDVPDGKYDSESYPDVHGGLTFAGACGHGKPETGICHIPGEGESDDVWWLGFDCAHAGDFCPAFERLGFGSGDCYKAVSYVRGEVQNLARQAAKVGASGIEARSDETPQATQPVGQEPGGEAETP